MGPPMKHRPRVSRMRSIGTRSMAMSSRTSALRIISSTSVYGAGFSLFCRGVGHCRVTPSWNVVSDGSRRRVVHVLSAMMTSAFARPDGKATGDPWFAWTSAHFTRREAGAKRFLAQTRYFAARQRCSTMCVTTITDRASGDHVTSKNGSPYVAPRTTAGHQRLPSRSPSSGGASLKMPPLLTSFARPALVPHPAR